MVEKWKMGPARGLLGRSRGSQGQGLVDVWAARFGVEALQNPWRGGDTRASHGQDLLREWQGWASCHHLDGTDSGMAALSSESQHSTQPAGIIIIIIIITVRPETTTSPRTKPSLHKSDHVGDLNPDPARQHPLKSSREPSDQLIIPFFEGSQHMFFIGCHMKSSKTDEGQEEEGGRANFSRPYSLGVFETISPQKKKAKGECVRGNGVVAPRDAHLSLAQPLRLAFGPSTQPLAVLDGLSVTTVGAVASFGTSKPAQAQGAFLP
ncbi:hypothetical protein GGTG_03136 [Gaeumannomyces tritici R3-111a-1]|uniref:Uncharacterized protein n=1 Tax=Gaeumannomyces tritici (strain R3-111a-1) TaxID=644352 RepID=J3NPC8_GAET3|nr:hypothetical protein GGTG_03136 [Gaeumannomyces tritici R3-111a-1]EJT78033.1 hypothetical protein GGTG_03136 [Gaeumannomyces tritici R3-111a-1]